jgi:lysophospholipase L1-like esterase
VNYEVIYAGGGTAHSMEATLAADIAAKAYVNNVRWIFVNLGANDTQLLPAEADWKADFAAILDALHARWPLAHAYVMRPWRRNYAAAMATLIGWEADVIAARAPWAHVGPDESFLEGGDNGASLTTDGIHPNDAGYALTAAAWRAAIGY